MIITLKVSVGMEQILTLARGWRVAFAPKMLAEDLLPSFYTVQPVMFFLLNIFFYTVVTGSHTVGKRAPLRCENIG